MAIMDGLATFELIKTGFMIFVFFMITCLVLYFFITDYNQHYENTTGTIIQNRDLSEILTYTVGGKTYTQQIPAIITQATQNAPARASYAYPAGTNLVYYSRTNPNVFNVGNNPTTITGIGLVITIILLVGSIIWFSFMRVNRNVAGVVGGIDVAHGLIGAIRS
jgi:hypothetical protein